MCQDEKVNAGEVERKLTVRRKRNVGGCTLKMALSIVGPLGPFWPVSSSHSASFFFYFTPPSLPFQPLLIELKLAISSLSLS